MSERADQPGGEGAAVSIRESVRAFAAATFDEREAMLARSPSFLVSGALVAIAVAHRR